MKNYIYSINNLYGNILYIGRTDNPKHRWSCHMSQIKRRCHEYITYDDYVNGLSFNVIFSVNCDKSDYLLDLIENVCISYYPCRNDIIINRKHYNKLEKNLAKEMLDNFINNRIIEEVDNSILDF